MTLCHLQRFGDITTVAQDRLFLFLSTCRINALDTALKFIFRLPVSEAFSNRVVLHQHADIIHEIMILRQSIEFSLPASKLLSADVTTHSVETEHQTERREPISFILMSLGQEEQP